MWSWVLLVASALSSPSPVQRCQSALERCVQRFEAAPAEYESSRCLFTASKLPRCEAAAKTKVRQLQAQHPTNDYLELVSGHFYWSSAPTTAIEHYRRAATGFAAARDSEGELIAQYNVLILLQVLDRTQSELRQQIQVIQELSRGATTTVAKARALAIVASYKNRWNLDLGAIYPRLTAYSNPEIEAFPYSVKREFLLARSKTAHQLLDYGQANRDSLKLAIAARANHDQETLARANFGVAAALLAQLRLYPSLNRAQRTRAAIDRALDSADQSSDIELIARGVLHLVEIQSFGNYGEQELQRLTDLCLRVSLGVDYVSAAAFCHIAKSTLHQTLDPERALYHALIATHTLSGIGTLQEKIQAWKRLLYASWERRSFHESMTVATVLVALLDELRTLQQHPINRRKIFASQTKVFDWLSTKLDERAQRDPRAHATAFFVQELARARVLADELESPRADEIKPSAPSVSEQLEHTFLDAVRAQGRLDPLNVDSLDKIQDQLLSFAKSFSQSRSAKNTRLAALTQVSEPDPGQERSTWTTDLAQQLDASEALLAYSFGRHDPFLNAGSTRSWVSVTTKEEHRVVDLPWDLNTLRRNIDFLAGLRGSSQQAQSAKTLARVREALFSPIAKALGPKVKRLIIVHDGALQNLPLASLAPHYACSVNPSATTWSMLAKTQSPPRPAKSLVLTDPLLAHSEVGLEQLRESCPALAKKLAEHPTPPLPHSRLETGFIQENLDPQLTHLTGEEATVQALRSSWGPDFGHLHLSAHTLSSPLCPDASALMLAPSPDNELGLLSAQMVSKLKLDHALVVLGGCSTAKGTQLQGEGVLSLARAFLMAGAQAVVASIWAVEDSEAKVFFKHFYAQLGKGIRVDDALKNAQQTLQAQGYQERAYAGYQVLGLGRHRAQGAHAVR